MIPKVSIIVAVANNGVIGKDNQLIWHLPADLKYFKNLTTGHHIIMGRKTFESIGKPLPNRTSIIITSNKNYHQEGCLVANSLEEAIAKVKYDEELFIIGGGTIYEQALPIADKLYVTEVHANIEGDVFFPEIHSNIWEKTSEEKHEANEKNKHNYSFCQYIKKQL